LVDGGCSGVFAAQILLDQGCTVIGTETKDNLDRAHALGMHSVLDIDSLSSIDDIEKVDMVMDCSSDQAMQEQLMPLVHKHGTYMRACDSVIQHVFKGGVIRLGLMFARARFTHKVVCDVAPSYVPNVRAVGNRLAHLTSLAEQGVIRPQIEKVYALDQTVDAYLHCASRSTRGRVAIDVTKLANEEQ
jgi:NADPH:quinone reductase-like Zn-dependent oxidoreductase